MIAAPAVAPPAPDLPSPRHVCFVTGEYPPLRGGVGDYTACLVRGLAELGVRCSVVTSRAARQPPERPPLTAAVYPALPGWGLRQLPHLLRLLDDLGPDVVHVQYQTGAFGMAPGINLLLPILRLRRIRPLLAVTFHDLKEPYLFPKAGPARSWANTAIRAAADLDYVTNGQDLARSLAVRRRGVHLLQIGSNVDPVPLSPGERARVRERLGLADDELAVGYFGFVDEWKGVAALVAACERLWRSGRRVRLVFVGGTRLGGAEAMPPYERAIRERLAAPQLPGRAIWTGFAGPDETSGYLQTLDVCALPFTAGACYRHGSLIAAIAHGLPIVTTRPSPAELSASVHGLEPLADGLNALLVEPNDAVGLDHAIARLADDPALRGRIAEGARALAPQFSWRRIARASLDAYEELLGRRLSAKPTPSR